ncbi:MAG: SsrA-binding protein SmpB [Chloroflexi bacterium]|nr:SsrA-binding protein SmpB [Chloroflexota bacterium]
MSKSASKRPASPGHTVAVNRRASYDYHILETFEAGVQLLGTEIKSIREGKVNLREGYAFPEKGELWLLNVHISPYAAGTHHNHEPTRPRKLLLHRDEIDYIAGRVSAKGLTLVPLRLYIKGHLAKVELGLALGKKQYDKRQATLERETRREVERALKHRP